MKLKWYQTYDFGNYCLSVMNEFVKCLKHYIYEVSRRINRANENIIGHKIHCALELAT